MSVAETLTVRYVIRQRRSHNFPLDRKMMKKPSSPACGAEAIMLWGAVRWCKALDSLFTPWDSISTDFSITVTSSLRGVEKDQSHQGRMLWSWSRWVRKIKVEAQERNRDSKWWSSRNSTSRFHHLTGDDRWEVYNNAIKRTVKRLVPYEPVSYARSICPIDHISLGFQTRWGWQDLTGEVKDPVREPLWRRIRLLRNLAETTSVKHCIAEAEKCPRRIFSPAGLIPAQVVVARLTMRVKGKTSQVVDGGQQETDKIDRTESFWCMEWYTSEHYDRLDLVWLSLLGRIYQISILTITKHRISFSGSPSHFREIWSWLSILLQRIFLFQSPSFQNAYFHAPRRDPQTAIWSDLCKSPSALME